MNSNTKDKIIAAAKVAKLEILIVQEGVHAEAEPTKEKRFSAILEKNGVLIVRTHLGSPFLPGFNTTTENDVVYPWHEAKEPAKPSKKAAKAKGVVGATAYSDGKVVTKGRRGVQGQTGIGLFDLLPEEEPT